MTPHAAMPDCPSALVTGATGYIGSRLVRRLAAEGWRVHAVVRPTSSLRLLNGSERELRLHAYEGSVASMRAIVAESKPDVVFHLAAFSSVVRSPGDIEAMIRSNVEFGTILLEAMKEAGASRLVNTGSFSQHYNGEAYNPTSLYAATKQAFEQMLRYYAETGGLTAVTLTLYDNYGPNDPRPKLINLLYEASLTGKPLRLSPGNQYIDLLHIEDVTSAYSAAARLLLQGQRTPPMPAKFAVSGGAPITVRELVERFQQVCGRPIPVIWGGVAYREREMLLPWPAGAPLPGWKPALTLEQGLQLFVNERESREEVAE